MHADKSWTLFLDRDGVINHEKQDGYILNWDEFSFYDEVLEAVKIFAGIFGLIIIVSNQRGVGKGLMKLDDLENIHDNMVKALTDAGGRIDRIYFCTSIDDTDPLRKPNPGMAFVAKKDFPQIDFSKSFMVGNNISDMEFGRHAGMHTVFLKTTHPDIAISHPALDFSFDKLVSFAKALQES